jgi:hypothetical protein
MSCNFMATTGAPKAVCWIGDNNVMLGLLRALCQKPVVEDANEEAVTRILKRASASRPSGQWSDEDYDVRADGKV